MYVELLWPAFKDMSKREVIIDLKKKKNTTLHYTNRREMAAVS